MSEYVEIIENGNIWLNEFLLKLSKNKMFVMISSLKSIFGKISKNAEKIEKFGQKSDFAETAPILIKMSRRVE